MGWVHILCRVIGIVGMLILAALPLLVRVPEPQGTKLVQASFAIDDGQAAEVSLPHAWPRGISAGRHAGEYRLVFTLGNEQERDQAQFLLIPMTRLAPKIQLNGQELFTVHATEWAASIYEVAHLARLPEAALKLGTNVLTIRLTREMGFRQGYLTPVSLGTAAQILPNYKLLSLLIDFQRIAVPSVFFLLALGVAGIWLARRRDTVYAGFCLVSSSSFLTNISALNPFEMLGDFAPALVIGLGCFYSMMIFNLASAVVGQRLPRWFLTSAFAFLIIIILSLSACPKLPLVGVFSLFAVGWSFASVVVLGRAFYKTHNIEYAVFMLAVMVIVGFVFLGTDIIIDVGHDRKVFLFTYPQIFLITAVAFILFRRLAHSLNTLDIANETMRVRLDEQQDELAKAHAHETVLSNNIAREQERQRLMRDLHDGLSGHIVSIIALAENTNEHDIEKTAREALDDLRLVIQSFDIGDEDVPVVLAYFRERTALQLRRLGISMEWAMDNLPTITGVTPGHALALLRLLQEAVTNAIKHGPARRITITGDTAPDGSAHILIENDGQNDLPKTTGSGLRNMHQRAGALGGEVRLEPLPTGMRLVIRIPTRLSAVDK